MRIGGLFSGIGGLELGLESSGIGRVEWMAEKDPFRRSVLARHWPGARIFEDVYDVGSTAPSIDLLCGGFPCQDLSSASRGRGKGIDGPRSGLWREYLRIVRALRPRIVVIENAPTWRRWVPVVRRELHGVGYASLPVRVSAADVGAPHRRPRVFVLAYSDQEGEPLRAIHAEMARVQPLSSVGRDWRTPPPGGFRLDDGIPGGMDQCGAFGDAVVPAVAEFVGRLIAATL